MPRGGGVEIQVVLARTTARRSARRTRAARRPADRRRRRDRTDGASTAPVKSRHCASSHAARRSRSIGVVLARDRAEALPDRSPQRAPHAFGRILQLRLDPRAERLSKSRSACASVSTANSGSTRASTGRSRSSSAQNPWIVLTCASSSDCSAVVRARSRSAGSAHRVRATSSASRSRSFSSPAAFSVNVTATIPSHLRAPGRQDPDDPVHELGRLAGARRRFDDERVVERARDRSSGARVVQFMGVSRWLLGLVLAFTVTVSPSAPRDRRASPAPCSRRAAARRDRRPGRKSHQVQAPLGRRRRQEAELDRAIDDLERLEADPAVRLVDRDLVIDESARGRAVEQPPRLHAGACSACSTARL